MAELSGTTQSSETASALVCAGRPFFIFMGPSLGGLAPLALSIDQFGIKGGFVAIGAALLAVAAFVALRGIGRAREEVSG